MADADTNYYPDTEEASQPAEPNDEMGSEANADDSDEGEGLGETFVVSKSIFGGSVPSPGDTVSFKVIHLYDDEVELQKPSKPKKEAVTANQEIDDMAMKGM